MRTLIVEDDFVSRRVLQGMLTPYGPCDVAVNGREAVEAFRMSQEEKDPYDLVCLDIMMPEMDGQEVLQTLRAMEAKRNVHGLSGAKVVMTTALNDFQSIMASFKGQCEAYLVKPITRTKLLKQLRELGLPV